MKTEYTVPIIELLWFDEDEVMTASGPVGYAAEQLDAAMRGDRDKAGKDTTFNITVGSVNSLLEETTE